MSVRRLHLLFSIVVFLAFAWQTPVHGGPPQILTTGAVLAGTNGATVGPDGRLYVASLWGQEIVVLDTATGEILDRLTDLDGDGVSDVGTPDDVAFGPDGSLYWTSTFTGEVGTLRPDGTVATQFVAPGTNPITVSDDGRVFVGLTFFGDALYELDPALIEAPQLVGEGYNFLNGFAFGPDGMLYTPLWNAGQVVRVDPDTGVVESILVTGLGNPAGVDIGPDGMLYGVDALTGELFRLDLTSGLKESLSALEPGLDNVAVGADGAVYITSFSDGSVYRWSAGEMTTLLEGGLIQPAGIAVLPRPHGRESVFVADSFLLKSFGNSRGEAQRSVSTPLLVTSVAEAWSASRYKRTIILTSLFSNSVSVWDSRSDEIVEQHFDFAVPLNALRFRGDLVVAEFGTGSVVRADSEDPSERATLISGLVLPAGLAADRTNLYVGDWGTGTVYQVIRRRVLLAEPLPIATGLDFPEGLAVDGNGNVLVVETGTGRLLRIHPRSGRQEVVAEGMNLGRPAQPNLIPTGVISGVAVGRHGDIYVAGDIDQVVYKISAE
jgi:sugar lactone lactonase YvrE